MKTEFMSKQTERLTRPSHLPQGGRVRQRRETRAEREHVHGWSSVFGKNMAAGQRGEFYTFMFRHKTRHEAHWESRVSAAQAGGPT